MNENNYNSFLSQIMQQWPLTLGLSVLAILILIVIYDVFVQKKLAILHNFPLLGHLRYFFIQIGPELRQYWVANDKEELPFNRSEREWIYASAHGENNTFGFGTSEQIYSVGYPIIKHSAFPFPESKASCPGNDPSAIPCLKVIGAKNKRRRPYRPSSIINVSAMSFGSLGENAISALNLGAKMAGCYHNTGEGGLSPYHLLGADVTWQIGTGYFGCRKPDGGFSLDILVEKVKKNPQVRLLEVKLSQGAKPGKGGILPGTKVTAEIAAIRGVEKGKDCISPSGHSEFSNARELVAFVEKIAQATGLPVGIKSAIGKLDFWNDLADEMKKQNCGPDFITIDGGEGGTGAAPLTFSDHVSLPFKIGLARVYKIFQEKGVSSDVVWIGSGKLGFPDRAVIAMAMGVDMINIARESMMSIGCIQAQKCHTGHCPAGVATQNKWLQAGLDPKLQAKHFANYIKSFRKELLSLAHASGYEHPSQMSADDIEFSTGVNKFSSLHEVLNYRRDPVEFTSMKDLTPV
jgi:glutamate synthase domain-containing protein 2